MADHICGEKFGECAVAYSAPHECVLDSDHRRSHHICGCGARPDISGFGFKIYFDFNDWWIGYYRGLNHHYVCPLPTLVIRWLRRG